LQLKSKTVYLKELLELIPARIYVGKLYVVGGLYTRGYTSHDIDLAVDKSLNEVLRLYFQNRLGLPTYIKTIRAYKPYLEVGKVFVIIEKI